MRTFKYITIIVAVSAVVVYLIFTPNIDSKNNRAVTDNETAQPTEKRPKSTDKLKIETESSPEKLSIKDDKQNKKTFKNNKDHKMPEVTYSIEEVFKLSEVYPKQKEKLLQIAKKPNPFLEEKIKVEPHSVQDLKQEEYGAIKVMAMRVILDKEKDKSIILQDLSDIIREAEDPTIVAIAESMKKSVTNNRDFTKDVTDALNNMPIEESDKGDKSHDHHSQD